MFYGIDLHSDSFMAAIIKKDDENVSKIKVSLSKEAFLRFLKKLTAEDYVAVEASTNTFWFVEQLQKRVKKCFIVDPFKFSLIANSHKKTDGIDAVKLAKKLKYFVLFDKSPDEFPLVWMPPKEVQSIRSLFTSYNLVKRQLTMNKNRIHSLLKQNGIICFKNKKLSANCVQREILSASTNPTLKLQLRLFVTQLQELESLKDELQKTIIAKGKIFDKEIKLLTTIKGISPFIAVAIMADIVDVNRFPNAKHLCSYLRAAPSINASGDKTFTGQVNKHSRKLSMCLMCECVLHFVSSSQKIKNFYCKKRAGKSAGKVRVAVIRKMIVTIYHMLKREQPYYYMDRRNYQNKIALYDKILRKYA